MKKEQQLPTLWLLGKTGAGKSSLIHALTGSPIVEIGNGFSPCTQTAQRYQFPEHQPLMQFLDTRGFSEAGYDPSDDIEAAMSSSHALVVVMKIDEAEQSDVLNALKKIHASGKIKHLVLVQTNVLSQPLEQRNRLARFQLQKIETVWKAPVESVQVDFESPTGEVFNRVALIETIVHHLPFLALMLDKSTHQDAEAAQFHRHQKEILWYAGAAAASDVIPAVGLVSVPAIQSKMLHALAKHYEITWHKRLYREFIAALGTSVAVQYSSRLIARQLIKFVPVYGQTLGATAAAAMSFGSTYGLARAAAYYFYQTQRAEPISHEKLQRLYQDALQRGKKASGHEK